MLDEVVLFADLHFDGGQSVKRLCTGRSWHSKAADSVGVKRWQGRIIEEPTFTLAVSCSPWGGRSGVALGSLIINNRDRALNDWLTMQTRDQRCVLSLAYRSGAYASRVQVHDCIVDEVIMDDTTLRVVLRGKESILDSALQRSLYSSSPEATLDGRPLPVAIGRMRQVEPVLYDSNGPDYKANDNALVAVEAVYSGGSLADDPDSTSSPDWEYDATRTGFEMQVQPSARITADLLASAIVSADALSGQGSFFDDAAWASAPPGWSAVEFLPNSEISQVLSVGVRFQSNGAATARITRTTFPTAAQWYLMTVDVPVLTSGGIDVINGASTVAQIRQAGRSSFVFQGKASSTFSLQAMATDPTDAIVGAIYVHPLDDDSSDADPTLYELVTQVAMRGGLHLDELDRANWPSSMSVDAGVFYSDQVTCREVIDAAMSAITGWAWVSPSGKLKCGQLVEPSGSDPLRVWRVNLTSLPRYRPDLAPSLSDTWAGGRNWSPYSETELAGITHPNRPPFMAQYRFTQKGTGTLAQDYRHAIGAEPIETFLYSESDVQAEANRVTALYASKRGFWTMTVALSTALSAAQIEPGDLVELDDTEYFGDDFGGALGLVVEVSGRYRTNELQLTVWVNGDSA